MPSEPIKSMSKEGVEDFKNEQLAPILGGEETLAARDQCGSHYRTKYIFSVLQRTT
jgi:uncharacterized protein YqfB (UPF0267 family)